KFLFFIIFLLFTANSFSSELDVLIAKTSLALGEEYGKISTQYREKMQRISETRPEIVITNDVNLLDSSGYAEALENYEFFKSLALQEFELVFCTANCSET